MVVLDSVLRFVRRSYSRFADKQSTLLNYLEGLLLGPDIV